MNPPPEIPWLRLEELVHRDPAGRGLASFRHQGAPLDHGQLQSAALELAHAATGVALVTGFCIADADPPAGETDGPPGALYLGRTLQALGIEVELVTDHWGQPLLTAGLHATGDSIPVRVFPKVLFAGAAGDIEHWNQRCLEQACGGKLSHLVAIERPGPSHTLASLKAQPRPGEAPLESFILAAPPDHRGACHNMRGTKIDDCHAPLHTLFEQAPRLRPDVRTIGILDGGNEIGAGKFPWETLRQAIAIGPAAWTACRVATDFAILAGVSNWGAYGLALAVAAVRGQVAALPQADAAAERRVIAAMVNEAGAVDGVTRRRELGVDGLNLDEYLTVLEGLRAAVGLPR